MNDKKYFDEISEIEKKYYAIIKYFDLNFPKPINLEEEKLAFFTAIADDKVYNPQIKYKKKNFDEKKIEELKKLKVSTFFDKYGIKKLYNERLKDKINEIECHKNWGKPISTKYVIKYRGEPSRILLSKAKIFCQNYRRQIVKFKYLEPEDIAIKLKNKVHELTGDKVKSIFIEIPSKVNIYPKSKIIKVNPHSKFTTVDLKRLISHEICVHYMRYYNGKKSGVKILETGTSNYIETEEGLAVYYEELAGVLSQAQMFIYAGRVIATYYSLYKSFYEVYQILKSEGFENEEAFAITYRAKRNLSDTSQKGGFTKDYVYFSGYLKIKEFVKHNDLTDLFIGKIKIEDLKSLKKFIEMKRDKIIITDVSPDEVEAESSNYV